MPEQIGEKEVVAIGNPESKRLRGLPGRISYPSKAKTSRQQKALARLQNLATNPKYDVDASGAPKLSRGQQKRADYKKRCQARAGQSQKTA